MPNGIGKVTRWQNKRLYVEELFVNDVQIGDASYTFPTTQKTTLAGTDKLALNDGADKYGTVSAIAAYLAATGTESLMITEDSGVQIERPAASSLNTVNWRHIVNQNPFTAGEGVGGENYANEITAIGWNLGTAVGTPAVAGKAAIWDNWEYKYNVSGKYHVERHMEMLDTTGNRIRFFSWALPHDGSGGATASHSLTFDNLIWTNFGSLATVSNATSNGGLIRLTVNSTSGWTTGQRKTVASVGGVTAANGTWAITVINATTVDLQGSTFAGSYTSGGTIGSVTYLQWSNLNRAADVYDTLKFRFNFNNAPVAQQYNAALGAFLNLPYFNASNQLLFEGQQVHNVTGTVTAGNAAIAHNFGTILDASSYMASFSTGTYTGKDIGAALWQSSTNFNFYDLLQNVHASGRAQRITQCGATGQATSKYSNGTTEWVEGIDSSGNYILGSDEFHSSDVLVVDKTARTVSIALPRSTTAALAAIGNVINTAYKFTNKAVINTTTGLIVTAAGATAGSVWQALDGTTAHTPI